jgi:2-polyprenyl-3-methyl-5-hydroxy-6-metoxy-1,4-benzoquinol methylase
MIKKQIRYNFNYVDKCNMCGSDASAHKILGKRLNQSQGKNPSNKVGISTTVAMCTECKLIYSNPQPVPIDIQDHYGVPPEEYWNENYFKIDQNYFKHEIDTLKGLIEFRSGMRSLDVGAGLGKTMIALDKAGFDAYGFEPSEPFYKRAVSKMGISDEKLRLGMLENVEYPENSFDFISFGAVLEHLYDPSGSIIKALKWLKPTGIVHIEVPSTDWLINDIINLYYKMTRQNYVGNLSPMHEPYHLYEFSLKSFEAHAKQNGYEIAFSEYYVCETYMPKISDLILKPYMKWTNKGMQLCVWLRKK